MHKTHSFSGYFSNRRGIKNVRYVVQWSHWFRLNITLK